jgi:hypothetical protein
MFVPPLNKPLIEKFLSDSDEDDLLPASFKGYKPPAAMPKSKSLPTMSFTLAEFAAQNAEIEKRNAQRARVAAMFAEDDEEERERESQEDIINEDAERELGTETAGKIRGALKRIGADLRTEAGFRCFGGKREERAFEAKWLQGVEWLHEGMLEEDLELVKDMLALGEELPRELIMWCMEHVAFERSQILALSYSDVFLLSLVKPNWRFC